MKNPSIRSVVLIGILIPAFGSFLVLFPQIRNLIIYFGSFLAHKTLNAPVWHERFIKLAIQTIIVCILCAVLVSKNFAPILNTNKAAYIIRYFAICTTALCIGIFFFHNINYPNFWYDESGQFWMAKGLNHYSAPFSETGNISDVLINNSTHNLDPGGFTILLHYVTFIGNSPLVLRLLPFSFFLLSYFIVTKLSKIWCENTLINLFSGFILFLSPLIMYYSFELRAYSMEMFATLFAVYITYKRHSIFTNRHQLMFPLLLGIILALGMSSRYSAIVSVAPLFLFIFFDILSKKMQLQTTWLQLILFGLPIVVIIFGIYFFTLRHQNPTGTPPGYTQDLMIKYSGLKSFFGTKLKVTIPFLILVILFIKCGKKEWFKPYNIFVIYGFIQNVFFIILSILGKYTWGINSRWDISTHTLFIISIIPLLFIVYNKLEKIHIQNSYLF
ncbi:MAG: glycosyltransferase family 39 protein [Bacteroidales bacterium]|jgi:hypothetical protein|nr:glycosyltransferase family 39 protein [Bacteroidales bacterium]